MFEDQLYKVDLVGFDNGDSLSDFELFADRCSVSSSYMRITMNFDDWNGIVMRLVEGFLITRLVRDIVHRLKVYRKNSCPPICHDVLIQCCGKNYY